MTADPSAASRPQDDKLLRDIAASPRPTGGAAIAAARARVTRELAAIGFDVRERPFEYSALPGRFATPLLGLVMLLLVALAGHWGAAGRRWAPLAVLVLGGFAAKYGAEWVARHGVLKIPFMRALGVNLEATPRGAPTTPRVWLCAHLDTKSQPVPTLIRVVGLLLAAIAYNVAVVLAILAAAGSRVTFALWAATALVTLVAAIPVVMSVVTARSPGALDNASGVATIIEAARTLGPSVGVLITDAEELGLAGARAWAAQCGRENLVLNCDGVDDGGGNLAVLGGRPGSIAAALPSDLGRRTRIPGVLTDAVAFADAGIASVTFMRGSMASLARVHSRRDDLGHLRGTGIAEVAPLISATVRALGGAP
jgi:hypothetical protein